MHEYEIRILRIDRGTSLVFSSSQPSDEVAIRLAKKLAEDRPLEVWRELDCICRATPDRSAA